MPYKQPEIKKIYYTIGEVAQLLDVNTSVVRYWEQSFSVIRPRRNDKGNRLFTQKDVDNFRIIHHLVRDKGLTLDAARKRIREGKSEEELNLEVVKSLAGIKTMLQELKKSL
jgi:DNA-binding transcriptional MerR regulator